MAIGTIGIIVGVILLILLKYFFEDTEDGENECLLIEEDPWSDLRWSTLTGNHF